MMLYLIAKTLKSLDFDVILDTNLQTEKAFKNRISEFGEKRKKYDVAFVYYAGHGLQVNNQNYLLPVKEKFNSQENVLDYGVSVQRIIRHLTFINDKVNVLILDACRNNPFESNWRSKNRSLDLPVSGGLAKIQAPSGILLPFLLLLEKQL